MKTIIYGAVVGLVMSTAAMAFDIPRHHLDDRFEAQAQEVARGLHFFSQRQCYTDIGCYALAVRSGIPEDVAANMDLPMSRIRANCLHIRQDRPSCLLVRGTQIHTQR